VSASIVSSGAGRYAVAGELTFATVPETLRASQQQFNAQPPTEIDLSAVTSADSAGVALMIEWFRWVHLAGHGRSLRFTGVPAQISALAKIGDVGHLLELTDAS
jgi:phospholipid transport system transporter-binding protein